MSSDFNILVHKIDAFRRKFLLFQFLRGFLLLLLVVTLFFFLLNILEYSFYLSAFWRRILFLTSLLFFSLVAIRFVLFPLIQLTGLIGSLNNRKATHIIQKLMPEIEDKLINIIELNDLKDENYSGSITSAAISQKINDLRLFNFEDAVHLRNLRTLFIYLVTSFMIITGVLLIDKSLITGPGNRIIHFNQEFVRPAPYEFVLLNDHLSLKKGENFTVKLQCKGEKIPSTVYINIEGNNFLMRQTADFTYEFEFSAVVNSVSFYFTDLKYNSLNFELDVIPVPVVNNFEIVINSPAYTAVSRQIIENIGDLKLAAGSMVNWRFECYDTDSLRIVVQDGSVLTAVKDRGRWVTGAIFVKDTRYEIQVKNNKTEYETIMNFSITITEDLYPTVKVIQIPDSFKLTRFFFKGDIFDDYGFTNLSFHVNIEESDSSFDLPVIPGLTSQEFYYTVDFNDFKEEGKNISYFFSVTDNDQVNGPKTATSESYLFTFPDRSEIAETEKENFNEVEKLLNESQSIAAELKNDLKELQMKNMNSNITDWEKSQLVNEILSKKETLESVLNQIEKLNERNTNFQQTFTEQNEELLKKQEQIQELLDEVMTDELKKLLEEFSKLAQEFNNSQLNELSKKMDMTFEDLSKQLERNLEMLKKMKIEQDLSQIVERVNEVQKSQEKGASEVKEKGDLDEILNKTELDDKEIEDVRQNVKDIMEMNNELKEPYIFDEFNLEFEEIDQSMEESKDALGDKDRKKSSKGMQNTSDMLKNLAFSMQQMIDANSAEEDGENMATIKQILKNLMYLSFEQENILKAVSSSVLNDPMLRSYTRNQRKLQEQSSIIKDSLYALSNRTPQLGNVMNNELMSMELNLQRSSDLMGEGLYRQSSTNQQLVVTAANNLALLLSEALENMEEQMANAKPGNKQGKKGKSGSMGMMKEQSENMRNQLQQMIDEMKKGQGKGMGKQLSESLMQHEMMQKMLRDLMNNGSVGSDARKQLQQIDQLLEQNRKDIMNKRVQQQLVQRQSEILTRLLEAEKSERERDLDNKRESNTADDKFYSNPAKYFEKNHEKNITLEYMFRSNLKLNNFYQDKYRNYVEKFDGNGTK